MAAPNQKTHQPPRRDHVVDVPGRGRRGSATDHHRRESPPSRRQGRLSFRRHPNQARERRSPGGIDANGSQRPAKAGENFNEIGRGKIRVGVRQNPNGPGDHRFGPLYLKKKPRRGVAGIGPGSGNGSKTAFESRRCSDNCSGPPTSWPGPRPNNAGKFDPS